MLTELDRELLEADGWVIDCESPFEISCDDSIATNIAAWIVLSSLRKEAKRKNKSES